MPNEPKVLMVASEATPFAKTGGLADVIGALSPTLRARGTDVSVIMPRYRGMDVRGLPVVYQDLRVWLGPDSYTCNVHRATERDVPYFLVDCPPLYDREALYGDAKGDYPDNPLRFAVFCRAALTMIRHVFRPNVIHCHDWQSALLPIYLHTTLACDPTFIGLPTILTIHNLGYQGLFPASSLSTMGLDENLFHPDCLEFFGKVNLLKGGILSADAVTTVSPTYAREIQSPELGFGLDGVLRTRSRAVTGILNGVDYTEWDPATDPRIPARYSPDDLSGKRACKAGLLAEFGLEPDLSRPLLGMVTRLAEQKGFDILQEVAGRIMAENAAFVILASGNPKYETWLEELRAAHPGRVGVRIAYDDRLAHMIEAGSDIFLMPSHYEPCGLNQIYSLRYGTVPVVRATGGLDDTIDSSTGFKFTEYSGAALLGAVREALSAFADRPRWTEMMLAGMRRDFSWTASAAQYVELYQRL
ncbi:MAG TPA: glycogen synthase GlgA [Bryobacteraceae bacterium]|nr:glycogen synthase GlgA [Bryobacteraceae bacterium]